MNKKVNIICRDDSTCIISKSFKNKLGDLKGEEICVGDIIEDENNNKFCITNILSYKELSKFYGDDVINIVYNNLDMKFRPVMHCTNQKKLEARDDQ